MYDLTLLAVAIVDVDIKFLCPAWHWLWSVNEFKFMLTSPIEIIDFSHKGDFYEDFILSFKFNNAFSLLSLIFGFAFKFTSSDFDLAFNIDTAGITVGFSLYWEIID